VHPVESLKLAAAIENLGEFMSFVRTFSAKCGFDSEKIKKLELAAEEALVNIFNYAYPEGGGQVELGCSFDKDGRLVMRICDEGVPFDGLSRSDPDTESGIEDRKIGGLGIFFIKKMADEVHYDRSDGTNILTMIFSA
jgi:anti-sigma regulatory factor (Ser/Thr protein kinase)